MTDDMGEYDKRYGSQNVFITTRNEMGLCAHPGCFRGYAFDRSGDERLFCVAHGIEFRTWSHEQKALDIDGHYGSFRWVFELRLSEHHRCAQCDSKCSLNDYLCLGCRG